MCTAAAPGARAPLASRSRLIGRAGNVVVGRATCDEQRDRNVNSAIHARSSPIPCVARPVSTPMPLGVTPIKLATVTSALV